jgi:hypothetical protein
MIYKIRVQIAEQDRVVEVEADNEDEAFAAAWDELWDSAPSHTIIYERVDDEVR